MCFRYVLWLHLSLCVPPCGYCQFICILHSKMISLNVNSMSLPICSVLHDWRSSPCQLPELFSWYWSLECVPWVMLETKDTLFGMLVPVLGVYVLVGNPGLGHPAVCGWNLGSLSATCRFPVNKQENVQWNAALSAWLYVSCGGLLPSPVTPTRIISWKMERHI